MSVLVVTFSYNRPNLLQLTTSWMFRDRSVDFSFAFFDDGSVSSVLKLLKYYQEEGAQIFYASNSEAVDRMSQNARANRIAILRHRAIEYFLVNTTYDYVMLRDDDVLTTCDTIREALEDFYLLERRKDSPAGGLTLHGLCTHQSSCKVSKKTFGELLITGEAHVLFSRKALLTVGNHFGPVKGGFADTQFEALRQAGFSYYTRTEPAYHVQHLGIGKDSSAIHRDRRLPFWNRELYTNTYTSSQEPLTVPGFDVEFFIQIAIHEGSERAALRYLEEKGILG